MLKVSEGLRKSTRLDRMPRTVQDAVVVVGLLGSASTVRQTLRRSDSGTAPTADFRKASCNGPRICQEALRTVVKTIKFGTFGAKSL